MTLDELDELEALAKAATPGPWKRIGQVWVTWAGGMVAQTDHEPDTHYIAAMNPGTALALITQIRDLRKALGTCGYSVQHIDGRSIFHLDSCGNRYGTTDCTTACVSARAVLGDAS